ncbi:MAG: AraC family transcriptional regulator [Anaerolineaceae bacterium]|nr:AraC family transcriptional regulator [Anaerolineaceae bacterium]
MVNNRLLQEKTKFWHDAGLNNLELFRATYHTFSFAPHIHDTYAIGVTESGAQSFTYQRTKKRLMPAGSVAVVHPGEVHTSQAANLSGWTYRMFYPAAELLQQVATELSGHPCSIPFFSSPVIHDADLARQIRNFHMIAEDANSTLLQRESILLWVIGCLVLRHADYHPSPCKANPEPDYVRRICRYMDEHFAEPLTVDQLARQAGFSPFHFLRIFRNTIGITPHAYLTHVRIERSKQLLLQGKSLAVIAAETGFVDQSHYSKYFKRMIGVSPGKFH